jgi:radical SAM/Cys-rich protein
MNNNPVSFQKKIEEHAIPILRNSVEVVQVNIGRVCNQACHHCHVESGPNRTENMEGKTVDRVIELIRSSQSVHTVDITGGAPEMNPFFKKLVVESRKLGKHVVDRCNLTILFEPKQEKTAEFLRDNQVHVIASLPCYSQSNVEEQRGGGVFKKSITALKMLNSLGYAQKGTGLQLDLVYNPLGAYLPPSQKELEKKYKKELKDLFNIEFNSLLTITNMPIKRFKKDLERSNQLSKYMELLEKNFSAQTAAKVMCRNLVSIAWNGELYDCDFNQMLELPLGAGKSTIWDINKFDKLYEKKITFQNHCYGCTAGYGSSCTGNLMEES